MYIAWLSPFILHILRHAPEKCCELAFALCCPVNLCCRSGCCCLAARSVLRTAMTAAWIAAAGSAANRCLPHHCTLYAFAFVFAHALATRRMHPTWRRTHDATRCNPWSCHMLHLLHLLHLHHHRPRRWPIVAIALAFAHELPLPFAFAYDLCAAFVTACHDATFAVLLACKYCRCCWPLGLLLLLLLRWKSRLHSSCEWRQWKWWGWVK